MKELILRRAGDRVLVVSPANLRAQWARELAERFDLSFTQLDSGNYDSHPNENLAQGDGLGELCRFGVDAVERVRKDGTVLAFDRRAPELSHRGATAWHQPGPDTAAWEGRINSDGESGSTVEGSGGKRQGDAA